MTLPLLDYTAPLQIEIAATAQDISAASAWLTEQCEVHRVPAAQQARLDLCLNEALANVIFHGGDALSAARIRIQFHADLGSTRCDAAVTVSDPGKPFDPLHAPIKPRPTSLETAEPGGHGLLMLRKFSDRLEYYYADAQNHLTFAVRWEGRSA